jgi:CO dehydrogenase/acetyl-CoA synthase gamma subunit (corrinoid Fe-S protein)
MPEYDSITRLGGNIAESMRMMADIQNFKSTLPGIDCGACGAPTCRAFAEDVIKKNACPEDCRLKDTWQKKDGKA